MSDQDPSSTTPTAQSSENKPSTEDEHQAVEVTFPANPTTNSVSPPPPEKNRRPWYTKTALVAVVFVLVVGLTNYGSYVYGYNRGHRVQNSTTATTSSQVPLQVPKGATIIEQCAVGRGTQYILPSDIPHGPVYNVYRGKVIGLEYMIGKDDLAHDKSFYNLPLYGKKYDHIDVGLLSQGHAGYPVPHYHVDIYNVSRAYSAAITCK